MVEYNEKLQTHYYDNKISEPISIVKENLKFFKEIYPYEKKKIELFEEFKELFISGKRGYTFFEGIYKDYLAKNTNNYDPLNDIYADDILFLILICLKYREMDCNILYEQFEEMGTGFCPQGRVNRLLQVYMAI